MELKELTTRTLKLFCISSVSDLGKALMEHLDDTDSMREYKAMVDDDLTKDWLQMGGGGDVPFLTFILGYGLGMIVTLWIVIRNS